MAKSVRTQLADAHQRARDLSNEVHTLQATLQPYERQVEALKRRNVELQMELNRVADGPIPMLLWCPQCLERHIDKALADSPHHTHACQHCGHVWRPAIVRTVGVQFLPGFYDGPVASGNPRTRTHPGSGENISVTVDGTAVSELK